MNDDHDGQEELIEKFRGAAQVAYAEDICLYVRQEHCAAIADEVETLKRCLRERDSFIVAKGLWLDFAGSLPVIKK